MSYCSFFILLNDKKLFKYFSIFNYCYPVQEGMELVDWLIG